MKRKSFITMALLIMLGVSLYFVSGTYAKYTSTVSGNGTAKVAEWNFVEDNTISTLNIALDGTVDASTLVSGRIAPGTSGSFGIKLKNTSEVGTDFTLALGTITNKPTNLKFYKDSTYQTEITPGTDTITGQIIAGDSEGVTVNVYWKWAYYTSAANDETDTTDGEAANSLTIPVTVTGTQVQPGAAITTHIN